ncbi:MAG TPA: hypothetical protein VIA62_14225 [Thermoanaerobaculia bacterium]|jgi:hypothetical protein|nr:hypothetical protein [Thermoanaerobaculia bacterium]
MSREGTPRSNVVDLRRWREERDRRLRAAAAAADAEATAGRPPDRIDGLYRLLALVAGLGFIAFGGFLGLLFLMLHREEGVVAWLLAAVLLLGLGGATALFGIDLAVRGILGREWTRPLWERLRAALDRRAHPLPLFAGLSALVLILGLWGGPDDPVLWEPAIFWFVGFLHIALHETGHLLAVRGMRYTPRRLVAGPLLVEWTASRRRVTANRDWRFLFGGNVWFSSARRTRTRDLGVLLAGPLANLLTLGTVLAVHRLLGGPALFAVYVRANAFCAGIVLLTNLLPLPRTREGYATDGRQILDLLRGRRIA